MKLQTYVFCGAVLALTGCTEGQASKSNGADQGGTGQTGMAIAAAANASDGTDVALIDYTIDRVACMAGETFDALHRDIRENLVDMLLPGGISAWENSPLDKDSKHPFADHFEVLPAGCYNVQAKPLAADASVSKDCYAAFTNGVQVNDGLTTEIFMISQCKGTAVGAIDSIVALNTPPELTSLTFSPSKFILAGQKTTVCATATDKENDPLEFAWSEISGGQCGSSVISDQKEGNSATECVEIGPMAVGAYIFDVDVYDLLHDENGKLIRFEDWLKAHGYPNTSHASLRFPVYVGAAL
jgi:hypothetical protein